MINFDLEVSYRNGMFYIYEECGSGVKYVVNTPKEAAMFFKSYIENYLVDYNRYDEDDDDEDYDDEIYED